MFKTKKREAIDDLIDAHVWLRSKAKGTLVPSRTGASGWSPAAGLRAPHEAPSRAMPIGRAARKSRSPSA